MKVLGYLVAFAMLFAAGIIINGYVLSIVWSWFVIPVFELPQLSWVQASGIALVARMAIGVHSLKNKHDDEDSDEETPAIARRHFTSSTWDPVFRMDSDFIPLDPPSKTLLPTT